MAKTQRFIVLPARGLRAPQNRDAEVGTFLRALSARMGVKARAQSIPRVDVRVIDSIGENGAKLVEMNPDDLSKLRANSPGVRVVPVTYFSLARAPIPHPVQGPKKQGVNASITLSLAVVSAANGSPVRGAEVVAFTNFTTRQGEQGITNAHGVVRLNFGTSSKKLERLYVYPKSQFWSYLKLDTTITNGTTVKLIPIDLTFVDCVRHVYPNSPLHSGEGVTVGIVDTGTGPHPDLNVAGGMNFVEGEDPATFGDNGDLHGTHVGGIIASRGTPPTGIRGIAPAATLRSYRVFPKGGKASNWAIAKAIDQAILDRCDLINMSLGETPSNDPGDVAGFAPIHSAIVDARAKGIVVISATGNEDRSPVDFPANESLALAVSAFGRRGTFPPLTTDAVEVKAPFGKPDSKYFVAGFSNVGNEVDLTGPGVGVISTVLGGFGVMSGTSMACPAVTGAAARLLSKKPEILSMPRDEARADQIVQEVLKAAKTLGFGPEFEGQGVLP